MTLTGEEVARHSGAESCWVIVHGNVYDVTTFLPEHPGGQRIILKYAGQDATEEFQVVHPPDTLDKYLDKSHHLGPVAMSTVKQVAVSPTPEDTESQARRSLIPSLDQCYNLLDFEAVAKRVLKPAAWAYYSSGADDEITLRENHAAFQRIWFRPHVMVDVTSVDISTTLLGAASRMPFYVSATALGKLGHSEGEVVLTRAAHAHGLVQMIPTLASCSLDEITDAAGPGQVQWLQLYVNRNRELTRRIVQHAERRGCRGLFVTVDAAQLGRREKDMRTKHAVQDSSVLAGQRTDGSQGASRALSSFIDPSLSWADIAWLRSISRMPLALKGVQRLDDVLRAIDAGVDAVVLSNHGGRQLDFARSGIEVLAEVMPALRARGLDGRLEVYVDGGIRRGTDILKALCLGARAVGIARPLLYAMSAYGQPGVDRAMALLRDELEMNMRLLGCRSLAELGPDLVDIGSLAGHANGVPRDMLSEQVYDTLRSPPQRGSKL